MYEEKTENKDTSSAIFFKWKGILKLCPLGTLFH